VFSDKTNHPYVHLMDGGLADNIGLRAIQDLYVRGGIRKKVNDGKIKNLLVIVVNAKNESPQKFDQKANPPGIATVGLKTCTISMDNYSFETVESIKQIFDERIKAQQYIESCQEHLDKHCRDNYKLPSMTGGQMKLYVVDISFDNISDKDEREVLKNLPTTFHLEKEEVNRLIKAGGRLLIEHPEFKAFMEEYR
jgi:NTE family protein